MDVETNKITENKEWILLEFVQNVFKCTNCSLDFYIPNFNPDSYSNFTLKVTAKALPKLQYENDPEH
jgi:hypothetical protein